MNNLPFEQKELLYEVLWYEYYGIPGHKFPRNHVAISAGLKQALLDIREFKYDAFRRRQYHAATRLYAQLCKERDDRELLENKIRMFGIRNIPPAVQAKYNVKIMY